MDFIPEDATDTMYLFDAKGGIILGLWHRGQHSSDMDWDIMKRRVDDPNDNAVSCTRHWLPYAERTVRVEKYPE